MRRRTMQGRSAPLLGSPAVKDIGLVGVPFSGTSTLFTAALMAASAVVIFSDLPNLFRYAGCVRLALVGGMLPGTVSSDSDLVAELIGADPRHPGVPCAVEPLAKVFADLGRQVKVPVLFHYSANDLYFNASTSKLWFERFQAGGAPAQYVLQPPFSVNGHYVFTDGAGARYWVPAVERFLRTYAVPFGPRNEA